MFLTTLPEAGMEVSESELVLPRLPDVVHCVGHLPLPDPGQLVPPGRRHCAVEGVLSGTLCEAHKKMMLRWIMDLKCLPCQKYKKKKHSKLELEIYYTEFTVLYFTE